MRKRWIVLAGLAVAGGGIYLANASWLAPQPKGQALLLAHRGMSQTFSHKDLGLNDCTATRIDPPRHGYLENTIPSMAESFRRGADIVEIDIHPTTDGQFAVFHDWTVDCRTDGHGVTRDQTMAYLKTLDIGYGYTADGGKTYPFRGKFVGAMPTFDEVLAAFPGKRFLINIKSNDPLEGEQLAKRLAQLTPEQRSLLMVYGSGTKPFAPLRAKLPDLVVMNKAQLKDCGVRYILFGWSGYEPPTCRRTLILVPLNYTWLAWGWPNRFIDRMQKAGSFVFVAGPFAKDQGMGLNTANDYSKLPNVYAGGIWTDEIEVIAPLMGRNP